MTSRRYRPVALLMLLLHLTGCYTWRPTHLAPQRLIETEPRQLLRITEADGSRVVLTKVVFDGDSIEGIPVPQTPARPRVSAALADVRIVETRSRSGLSVVLLAGAMGLVLGMLVIAEGFDDFLGGR